MALRYSLVIDHQYNVGFSWLVRVPSACSRSWYRNRGSIARNAADHLLREPMRTTTSFIGMPVRAAGLYNLRRTTPARCAGRIVKAALTQVGPTRSAHCALLRDRYYPR